jgi:hypothetical protein
MALPTPPTARAALPGPPSLGFHLRQKSAHLSMAMDAFGLVNLHSLPCTCCYLFSAARQWELRQGPRRPNWS